MSPLPLGEVAVSASREGEQLYRLMHREQRHARQESASLNRSHFC
jgi:hypothetical protein